jgi:EmrB/QacA subfamily drug resistance transporter
MEAGAPAAEALPASRKRLVLVAAILGTTVVTVDSTVVNVALPAIANDLGGGLAGQQWTSNAYLVTLGSLLLIGGSLGDIFGERRVFLAGVIGFGATSLICALAPTIEVLIAGRALQGIAGAALTPAALAVIVSTFPPAERGKAIGAWTAWGGIGTVLGPLIGGQLVDAASWRWIFAINLPIVLVTTVLIARVVPAGRERDPDARVDLVGALTCALGLAGVTFALIEQPLHGWGSPVVFVPLVLGAVVFASFLLWEARTPRPMLPLGLFRRRNFAAGNVETFAMYGGLGLLFFFLVLYLQQVAGFNALEAGTSAVPVTVMMFLLSTRFGALADRYGPRFFMGVGPLVAAAGMAWLLRIDADVDYLTDLLPALLVFGLGLSMTVAPLTATVLADADESNAGIASGVNNAIARVAGLVAIAAVGAVVSATFASRLDDEITAGMRAQPRVAAAIKEAERQPLTTTFPASGMPQALVERLNRAAEDASVYAFHVGIGIAVALVGLGGVLGLVGIRNPSRRVEAAECPGGQLVGYPRDATRQSPCDWGEQALDSRTRVPRAADAAA